MEYCRVGKHEVCACPHCDKLFDVPATEPPLEGIERIEQLYTEHLATSAACKTASDALPGLLQLAAELRPTLRRAEEERQKALAANPHNGTLGYWLVEGIRHDARCKARSAPEAVDKCIAAGAVGDWEAATAVFLGEELPEVF